MYSYEDRVRAVQLYIKLGKRSGATIRQLGYPTKNSLKNWHEEYERSHDLSRGYVRSKPKYSQAQKERAIEHYLEHGRRIAFTVKALGYPCRVPGFANPAPNCTHAPSADRPDQRGRRR